MNRQFSSVRQQLVEIVSTHATCRTWREINKQPFSFGKFGEVVLVHDGSGMAFHMGWYYCVKARPYTAVEIFIEPLPRVPFTSLKRHCYTILYEDALGRSA